MIGTTIGGRYRPLRALGRGALGTVFEAERLDVPGLVALKVLSPQLASDSVWVERFLRGAEEGARMAHPNIVGVVDLGRDASGAVWLAQELLEGEDLQVRIRRGRLPASSAVPLLEAVLDALAHVHARDVVHRDVKPSNVFLARTESGEVPKLLDFGFAKSGDPHAPPLTSSGTSLGSPLYMAPEVLRGAPADQRCDQWSAAVTLYEALAGTQPFRAPSLPNLILVTARDAPPPLSPYGVPAPIEAAILRALSKRPADRWPSVAAFRSALLA